MQSSTNTAKYSIWTHTRKWTVKLSNLTLVHFAKTKSQHTSAVCCVVFYVCGCICVNPQSMKRARGGGERVCECCSISHTQFCSIALNKKCHCIFHWYTHTNTLNWIMNLNITCRSILMSFRAKTMFWMLDTWRIFHQLSRFIFIYFIYLFLLDISLSLFLFSDYLYSNISFIFTSYYAWLFIWIFVVAGGVGDVDGGLILTQSEWA